VGQVRKLVILVIYICFHISLHVALSKIKGIIYSAFSDSLEICINCWTYSETELVLNIRSLAKMLIGMGGGAGKCKFDLRSRLSHFVSVFMFCADLDAFILPCVHIPNLNTRWK
jgi:hypothetical protein